MLRIGLTGGIGSGKSTVAELFARRGAAVIDADDIARALAARGTSAYREIIAAFGPDVLTSIGELDRRRLRVRVFDDPEARRRLEAILHPRVRAEITARVREAQAPYCVIVIPLLFEAGQGDLVDRVLVVDTDEATQVKRVTARNRLPEDDIRKIIAAQLPRAQRLRQADDVLTNDADLAALEQKVDALHRRYLTLACTDASSS